jgi:multiple sugar transport system permease protein
MATDTAAPDSQQQAGPPKSKEEGMSERNLARAFMAPSITTMVLVAGFPIIWAAFLSLFAYTGRQQTGFAGLGNYVEAFTDPRFWDSVIATFVFTVSSVFFEFIIGMVFALIMNKAFFGRGVTRATILIPWVIPTVISAQMWFFMFNITPGFINSLLPFVPADFNWLGSDYWAMFAMVFADVWKTAPFVALLLLAGLQTIPNELYEAGRVDGANAWQRFRSITLPLLRPAILVALLFRTVDALRIYDLPAVMTNGAFGTETLSVLVQQFVVQTPDPGLGSAFSTLTFAIVLGVGIVFISVLGRDLVIGVEE